jgi:hypothetical protein
MKISREQLNKMVNSTEPMIKIVGETLLKVLPEYMTLGNSFYSDDDIGINYTPDGNNLRIEICAFGKDYDGSIYPESETLAEITIKF